MANIGDILLQPEIGFKRVSSSKMSYRIAGEIKEVKDSKFTDGSAISLCCGNSISFSFHGTEFYIISDKAKNTSRSRDIKIDIDGVEELFNPITTTTESPAFNVVQYSSKRLKEGYHHVTITNYGNSGLNDNNKTFIIDAIDVAGHIGPYTLKHNTIRKANVGDYILADYTPNSNGVGEFSNIGNKNAEHSFICVKSTDSKKWFISSRNIDNVTFDNLNKKGYVYGNLIESGQQFDIYTRLIGGSSKSNSPTNEWDNFITANNLDGLISAGDDVIWNWRGEWSLTRSMTSNPINISVRGNTLVDSISTVNSTALTGYRPMFIVDIKYDSPMFDVEFLSYGVYPCGGTYTVKIKDVLLDSSISPEEQVLKISIVNTDNDIVILDTDCDSIIDVSFDITLNSNMLQNGKVNPLKVTVTDINEVSTSKIISIYVLDGNFIISNKCILTKDINILSSRILIHVEPYNAITFSSIDKGIFTPMNFNKYNIVNGSKMKLLMFENDEKISSYGVAFC